MSRIGLWQPTLGRFKESIELFAKEVSVLNLLSFVLVVLSLGSGSLGLEPHSTLAHTVGASAAMLIGWGILAYLASRSTSRAVDGGEISPVAGAGMLETQIRIFQWIGIVVVAIILVGFGWAAGWATLSQSIQQHFGVDIADIMFAEALWLFLPAVAVIGAASAIEHRYGVRLGYVDRRPMSLVRAIGTSLRSTLALLAVPVLGLMAASDVVRHLPVAESMRGTIDAAIVPTFAVLFLTVGLPAVLRLVFRDEAMPEADEAWIREIVSAVGVRGLKIRLWNSGGTTFNAMVAGFVPPMRSLMVSDRLMSTLPPPMVAMVVLHEAAHLRRRHLPIRLLAMMPPWALAYGLTAAMGDHPAAPAIGLGAGVAATLAILHVVSRRTELDADATACRMAASIGGRIRDVPSDYTRAAETLEAALKRVTFDNHAAAAGTWLHPSLKRRVESMRDQSHHQRLSSAGGAADFRTA